MDGAQIIFVIIVASWLPPPINGVGDELYVRIGETVGRAGEDTNWCYEDSACSEDNPTSAWKNGVCASGTKQSPINVETKDLKVDYEKGCPIDFGLTTKDAYNLEEYKLYLRNYTLEADPLGAAPTFRFPAVNDGTYTLVQAHFHWGPDSTKGSEHEVDGIQHAMELHLVHFRSGGPDSYTNIADAIKSGHQDALAVIGIFLKVDQSNNAASGLFLEHFVKAFVNVAKPGDEAQVKGLPFKLHDQIKSQTQTWTYEGSLTTPHCNEIVQWIVLKDPVPILATQVEEFRKTTGKKSTFRKVQNLNNRKLKLVEIIH